MRKVKEVKEVSHSEQQAGAQLESIRGMVEAMRKARKKDNDDALDKAQQTIQEDALSVEMRSAWVTSQEDMEPAEFKILLCTGGPAVRIIGELSEHGEPESARLEHQDWGTPWTEYRTSQEDEQYLIEYSQCFYYGGE